MIRSFLLSVLALLMIASPSQAQTVGEVLTFKRIGLLEIEDQTKKGLGKKIGELIRRSVRETFRFEIVQWPEAIQLPGQPEEILRLSKPAAVDLVVAGQARWAGRSLKLTLVLFEGKTGEPFAIEHAVIKGWRESDLLDRAVKELVSRLIGRIPYKALVTKVEGEKVRLGAGALSGVEEGLKATVLEIKRVKRHPFTGEVIGFQIEEIAQLAITEVTERSSIAILLHTEKGKKIRKNQKIRFHTSQAALARAEVLKKEVLARQQKKRVVLGARRSAALPKPAPTAPTENIQLALQTGLFNDTFEFDSNEFNFVRESKAIPSIELQGDVWLLSSWGLGLAYRQSWTQFDEIDNSPIDVDATMRWIEGGVRYRYLFKKAEGPPALIMTIGYQLYQFRVDEPDQSFFVDYSLHGPVLGFEGVFPLSHRFGLETVLDYFPILDYREESVSSGTDSEAMGYRIKVGGYYRLGERAQAAVSYNYMKYMVNFSGIGTRGIAGVTDARSEETFNGFNLSFLAVF